MTTRHYNETFVDQRVDLTGQHWERCTFNGCIVEAWRGSPTKLNNSHLIDCRLEGDGWPPEILRAIGPNCDVTLRPVAGVVPGAVPTPPPPPWTPPRSPWWRRLYRRLTR